MSEGKKFKISKTAVLVARIRIETLTLFVEGDETEQLQAEALKRANALPAKAWKRHPFNSNDYAPFVVTMAFEQGTEEELADFEQREQFDLDAEDDRIRFLPLIGFVADGTGEIALQPWFVAEGSELANSEIAADWLDAIEALGLGRFSERLATVRPKKPRQSN